MNQGFYSTKLGSEVVEKITRISELLILGKYMEVEKLVGQSYSDEDVYAYYEGYLSHQRYELQPWSPRAFPNESILKLNDGSYVIRAILPSFVEGRQVDSSIRLMIEVSKEGNVDFKGLTY